MADSTLSLSSLYVEALSFDESLAPSLNTSIRIDTDGITLWGSHCTDLSLSVWGHISYKEGDILTALKQVFYDYPVLSLPYRTLRLSVDDGSGYVVIPRSLSSVVTPVEWMGSVLEVRQREVMPLDIADTDIRVVYGIDRPLYEFCQRSFSIPAFDHPIRSLISTTATCSRRYAKQVMSVLLSSAVMDVVVAKEGRILIANRYKTPDPIDALYFITAVWRQLQLDDRETPLYLYGSDRDLVRQIEQHLSPSLSALYANHYPFLSPRYTGVQEVSLSPELIMDRLCE